MVDIHGDAGMGLGDFSDTFQLLKSVVFGVARQSKGRAVLHAGLILEGNFPHL